MSMRQTMAVCAIGVLWYVQGAVAASHIIPGWVIVMTGLPVGLGSYLIARRWIAA